jgi:hypothetical protein
MKQLFIPLCLGILMAGCAGHSKKILLYASSDIQVDNSQKNITVTEGTTHQEKELQFSGNSPVELSVQSPGGKYTLQADGDGYFLANLKPDTIIGSLQHLSSETNDGKITQERLKQIIDSLEQLTLGKNVSEANKNYFLPPGKIVRISTKNDKIKVFGPYDKIPGAFDASPYAEIYKFYTIKDIREMMAKLPAMTKF